MRHAVVPLMEQTVYCPNDGRWLIWQGGHEPHQRPCPECGLVIEVLTGDDARWDLTNEQLERGER